MSDKDFEDDQPPTDHNEGKVIRLDLIRKLAADLRPLEAERERVNQAIRDARGQFKEDTGITLSSFDAARRLANLEDDERKDKLDELMACFNTLTKGDQLDWIAAVGDGDA